MFVQQRHELILKQLHKDKSIRASALMEMFGVSFETIRRDLEFLENEGYLKRVHGGAILREWDYSQEIPLPVRESIFTEEKTELAHTAMQYVEEGMSVALDTSTTNLHVAQAMKETFERLTIITNSLPIIQELLVMPNYTLIVIGGVIRQEEQCVIGDFAEEFAARFHADLFLMSLSGVTVDGITDNAVAEVQVKKRMLANAKRTIALTDSSKFEQLSLLKVCSCAEVERFVTDSRIDPAIVHKYREHGIEVVYANEPKQNGM